jgi:hypothetical protein
MNDNAMPVLRARQPEHQITPAASSATEALDIEMRRAQAISNAVQALPPAYQKQPGAVLLVDQWARSHGVDTLTAIQSVAFVKGRPVVDASMQRALASRAGYDVEINEGDGWAEVSVTRNGRTKSARFTMDDAKNAGLLGKDNWKNYATDMLVARATARCLRRHAPEVVLGISDPDELDSPMDVLHAAATATTAEDPDPVVEVEQQKAEVDDIAEAEIVVEPADEVFYTPPLVNPPPVPATPAPTATTPATATTTKAKAKREIMSPAEFKSHVRTYPGWTSVGLVKAMAANGHSCSIEEIVNDPDLYGHALDLLETNPAA